MDNYSDSRSKKIKTFQLSTAMNLFKRPFVKVILWIYRAARFFIEKLIYFGGLSEYVAVKWLLRIYRSKFRLDWELSKLPPHFYNHRMGMTQFTFGETTFGPILTLEVFLRPRSSQTATDCWILGAAKDFLRNAFSLRTAHT